VDSEDCGCVTHACTYRLLPDSIQFADHRSSYNSRLTYSHCPQPVAAASLSAYSFQQAPTKQQLQGGNTPEPANSRKRCTVQQKPQTPPLKTPIKPNPRPQLPTPSASQATAPSSAAASCCCCLGSCGWGCCHALIKPGSEGNVLAVHLSPGSALCRVDRQNKAGRQANKV
jgi:hypothetical protein